MTLWRRETLPPHSGCVCASVCICDSTSWFSCSTRSRRRAVTFPAFPNTSPTRHVFYELTGSLFTDDMTPKALLYLHYYLSTGNTWIAFQRPQLLPVGKVKLWFIADMRYPGESFIFFFKKKKSLDLCQQIFIYLLFVAGSCFVPACCNCCPPNHMGNLHQFLWCTPESKKCSRWAHFYLLHQLPLFIQFRVPHPNNAISAPFF